LYNQLGMMKTAQKLFGLSPHSTHYRMEHNSTCSISSYRSIQATDKGSCKGLLRSAHPQGLSLNVFL